MQHTTYVSSILHATCLKLQPLTVKYDNYDKYSNNNNK